MEYHRCQPPCSRFIASDEPHSKCVKCMDFSHAHECSGRPLRPYVNLRAGGSDVELEAMESEQKGLALSLPLSPEHVHVNSLGEFAH